MRNRRFPKPRKIGADSSSEDDKPKNPTAAVKKKFSSTVTTTSTSKRPISTLTTNLSFTADPADSADSTFSIKKSALSRKALERAAAARGRGEDGEGNGERGAVYSKEYLEELRSETPSAPFEARRGEDGDVVMGEDGDKDPLGTISKFGTTAAASAAESVLSNKGGTSIPDPALIQVLKARRAASAAKPTSKSKSYISLSPSHSGDDEDDYPPKTTKKPSRLVRTDILDEDDDPALSTFIHDPSTSTSTAHPTRLILTSALSSRAGAQQEATFLRRGQIQEALALSSGSCPSSASPTPDASDDDETEFNPAKSWHRRQLAIATGSGTLGADDPTSSLDARLRYQPPNIPPMPELEEKLKWLGEVLGEMVRSREVLVERVEEVRRERVEIGRREREVQEGLGRMEEEYKRLGLGPVEEKEVGKGGGMEGMGRGLESLGGIK